MKLPNRTFRYCRTVAITPLLALAACGQPEALVITPPASLLTCADEPAPPAIPARDGTEANQLARDLAMLDGYLALRSAYGDCRAKVDGLRAWSETLSD